MTWLWFGSPQPSIKQGHGSSAKSWGISVCLQRFALELSTVVVKWYTLTYSDVTWHLLTYPEHLFILRSCVYYYLGLELRACVSVTTSSQWVFWTSPLRCHDRSRRIRWFPCLQDCLLTMVVHIGSYAQRRDYRTVCFKYAPRLRSRWQIPTRLFNYTHSGCCGAVSPDSMSKGSSTGNGKTCGKQVLFVQNAFCAKRNWQQF